MRKIYWLLFLGALFRPALGEEALSMEFLEFLGEWEDDRGNWVDPLSLPEAESVDFIPVGDEEKGGRTDEN